MILLTKLEDAKSSLATGPFSQPLIIKSTVGATEFLLEKVSPQACPRTHITPFPTILAWGVRQVFIGVRLGLAETDKLRQKLYYTHAN